MKQYLLPFLVGVALVAIGIVMFWIGKERGYSQGYDAAMNEPHKADTVWRTDTITIDHPVEKWRTVEKLVYIPVTDSVLVHHHDTTYIAMERERKGYSGEDYSCEISGIDPRLETISVFPKTMIVTNTVVQKKRFSWSATVGPGAFWNGGPVQFGVGAVVGFGYNF